MDAQDPAGTHLDGLLSDGLFSDGLFSDGASVLRFRPSRRSRSARRREPPGARRTEFATVVDLVEARWGRADRLISDAELLACEL